MYFLEVEFKFLVCMWLSIIWKDTCNDFKLVADQHIFNGSSLEIGLGAIDEDALNQYKSDVKLSISLTLLNYVLFAWF